MIDDSQLLRRFVEQGSSEAFAELVKRHIEMVFSAALRRVGNDSHLAEDVTQSVFITLARKAPTLLGHPVLGGWLHRCTHYAAIDSVRAQRRQVRHEEHANTMISDPSVNQADWKQLGPVVDALIDELGDAERDALVLRFFEGRSFPEIGVALKLTEDAARMRVNRALERLRQLLARRGVTSSVAALGLALANHVAMAAPAALMGSTVRVALANAGAIKFGAVGTSGVAHFMSSTKMIVAVTAVIAIASTGIAVRQTVALHDARAALAREASVPFADELSTRSGPGDPIRGGDRGAPSTSRRDAAEPLREASAMDKPASGAAETVTVHMADILKDNPDYARIYARDMRRNVIRTYGDYLQGLGLPGEQIAKLEDLLAERALSPMDASIAAEARGLARGSPAWSAVIDHARHEVEAEINAILARADLNLNELKDRANLLHQIKNNYGPHFTDSDIPPSSEQYRALTQIFIDASTAAKTMDIAATTFTQPDPATGLSEQDNEILANASRVLTPAQLNVLRDTRIESHVRDATTSKYVTGDQRLTIKNL